MGLVQALEKHHFLVRRLHSLTGIVPIGVFLIAHLVTNSSLLWGSYALRGKEPKGAGVLDGGVQYFQHEVRWINEQIPHLLLIEITLWGSIAFHSILGVFYAASGRRNTERYAYQDNWRYTLQRWTGYIGILFIFYHVATLRWGWDWLVPGGTLWSHSFSASTLAAALQGSPEGWTFAGLIVALLYFLGVTALVFHFANGLWTAAITWGVTITQTAQRRWGYGCAGLGVLLMGAGWASLGAALALDYDDAWRVEYRMLVDEVGPEAAEAYIERKGIRRAPLETAGEPAAAGADASPAGSGTN